MHTSGIRLALMLLIVPAITISQQVPSPTEPSKVSEGAVLCNLGSLPPDVRSRLKAEFGSWKVQEPADLSPRAHERWGSEKPLTCPGIAVGKFESADTLSYAVLLVPQAHKDAASYKFLVFSPKAGRSSYEMRTADSGNSGAANFFIHRTPINKFFDEPSRKKFQAHTVDGILLIDSAENEYGVEVYFWSLDQFRHEPVDY